MHEEPLNPTLFRLLERRFGEGEVVVIAAGQSILWHPRRKAVQTTSGMQVRLAMEVDHSGEEYRVHCPFCQDTRRRLFINHRWGVWDESTRTNNLWLAQCFNETRCLSDYDNQKRLFDQVYTLAYRKRKDIKVNKGRHIHSGKIEELAPPGPLIPLEELLQRHPHHHALRYLQERHLDPLRLSRVFGVSYCPESRYNLARDRIIIPIRERGLLVGWQARYIGDDVNGRTFKQAKVPKYWTSPGMPRSLIAYNFERAVQYPTAVIVEGPPDVWSFGLMSMGLLGLTMSALLRKKFVSRMQKNWGEEAAAVVMLDPTQNDEDIAKGKPHHIEVLRKQLYGSGGLGKRVVPVYLPEGTDPGGTERSALWDLARQEAAKLKVRITFKKPK